MYRQSLPPYHCPLPPSSQAEEDTRAKYEAHLETYEKTHMGGFRRIYPNGNEEYYSKFFNHGTSLCAETAASKARTELSRQQREEIEAKQKELQSFRKKLGASADEASPVKSKFEGPRPESPQGEKRKVGKTVSIPRRASFRLPTYLTRAQRKEEPQQLLPVEEVSYLKQTVGLLLFPFPPPLNLLPLLLLPFPPCSPSSLMVTV